MTLTGNGNNHILNQVRQSLLSIGYRANLLFSDYEYADVTRDSISTRRIALAGFAQSPPSYRDACVGIVVSNGISGAAHVVQHRSLGAPLIFEIGDQTIGCWKTTKSGEPELREKFRHDQIEKVFASNKQRWNPDSIFRAKSIRFDKEPVQLDFIDIGLMPSLQEMIHKKLDQLLRNTLAEIITYYEQYNKKKPDPKDLFRLVFRFIAAKVFRDRGVSGEWQSDDAITALKAVENYYNIDSNNTVHFARQERVIVDRAWELISSAFHFQNLSVDDLAFIYENTLITKETRKTLGTHSTPPEVAEYIVGKLRFEDLPESGRRVLEPCSGHGIFLLSAMRRLRELLPPTLSDRQRHNYLVKMLVGIELDEFAIEVSRLCLMLADYPNPDGWRLYADDVYLSDRLDDELKRANIVLCNPPFEDFNAAERKRYGDLIQAVQKPSELLRRILSRPQKFLPKLLGTVLPLRFISDSAAYRDHHFCLARNYGRVEIVEMPEVFNYSDARTVLLLASDLREGRGDYVAVTNRVVNKFEFRLTDL